MKLAIVSGIVAFFITSGLASWATPHGNLVVTLVPAVVAGSTVFGLALLHFRRRTPD